MTWGEGLAVAVELGIVALVYVLDKLGLLPKRRPKPPAEAPGAPGPN